VRCLDEREFDLDVRMHIRFLYREVPFRLLEGCWQQMRIKMVIAGTSSTSDSFPCTPHQTLNNNQTKSHTHNQHYSNISINNNFVNSTITKKAKAKIGDIPDMFPQPDAETLARNPQFALLWKDLTTNKITREGVSKSIALDKETVRVRETLKSKRIEQARREMLRDVVRAVAFGEGEGGLVGDVSCVVWQSMDRVNFDIDS